MNWLWGAAEETNVGDKKEVSFDAAKESASNSSQVLIGSQSKRHKSEENDAMEFSIASEGQRA